jgi:hybrid cluster-associated redox disulfide protein
VIDIVIVLIAFSALGIAAVSYLRLRVVRDSLREGQRRLYLVQARLNELENTMQRELQVLRALARQRSGSPVLESTMKIADAIALDPRIRDVLAQFHLGGCSSCAIDEEHTIEQAALSYGIDVDRLMAALTSLGHEQEPLSRVHGTGNLFQLKEF